MCAEILKHMREVGNAASGTHDFGAHAKQIAERARMQIGAVVGIKSLDEIIFTSGATESNNLALLGLAEDAARRNAKHIITTAIEHKAVLAPIKHLQDYRGFSVTHVYPTTGGWVDPRSIAAALRPDTSIVSVMHVNNETGVEQPIEEIAQVLCGRPAYFHVDAAQGFGKSIRPLRNSRVDLISVSGHKIYGPKGIGALVARSRGNQRIPLTPLIFGGEQEGGLRPGTLPVPLVSGLGLASELALQNWCQRRVSCETYRQRFLNALQPLQPIVHGDQNRVLPHTVSLAFRGICAKDLMLAWKDIIAVSTGAACSSGHDHASHVLLAMGVPEDVAKCTVRVSWCHMTEEPDWDRLASALRQ